MSIIRVETPDGRTKGWQARATVAKGFGYLSRLCKLKRTDEQRVRYYLDFARARCRFELANDRLIHH